MLIRQLTIATLFLCIGTHANAERIWLDDHWDKTTEEQAAFYYEAPLHQSNGRWDITIYFKSTGKPKFESVLNGPSLDTGAVVGPYRIYYENGNIQGTGQHDSDGEFVGINKSFTEDGYEDCAGEYKDSKGNGPHRCYYRSGKISNEYHEIDDKREGLERNFREDGSVSSTINWHNDKREGLWKEYYDDGTLKEVDTYHLDNPLIIETFYKTGQRKVIEHFNVDNKRDGLWEKRTKDGTVTLHANYQNGQIIGEYTKSYDDGTPNQHDVHDDDGHLLLSEHFTRQGKLLSRLKQKFNQQGELASKDLDTYYGDAKTLKSHTHEAAAQALKTTDAYDRTGKLIKHTRTVNGLADGKQFERHKLTRYNPESEELITVTHYHQGKLDGEYSEKSTQGTYDIHGYYKNGNKVGDWRSIKGGDIRTEHFTQGGQQTGELKVATVDGKVKLLAHYRNGKLNGSYVKYDNDGALEARGNYVNGNRDGHWRFTSELVQSYSSPALYDEGDYRMGKQVGDWATLDNFSFTRLKGHFDNNGKRTGAWYSFEKDGLLTQLAHYKNGEYDGEYIRYSKGQVSDHFLYHQGQPSY